MTVSVRVRAHGRLRSGGCHHIGRSTALINGFTAGTVEG